MKTKLLALMIALPLLTACGGAEDGAAAIRQKMAQAGSITATLEVTADYGETAYTFTLRYEGDGSSGTVTVVAPEAIAGVTARIGTGDDSLTYGGVTFETGPLYGRTGPLTAVGILMDEWRTGYVTAVSGGSETWTVTTEIDDATTQTTVFDSGSLLPLHSELYREGRMVLKVDFTDTAIT